MILLLLLLLLLLILLLHKQLRAAYRISNRKIFHVYASHKVRHEVFPPWYILFGERLIIVFREV